MTRRTVAKICAVVVAATSIALGQSANAAEIDEETIEGVVERYLLENPQTLERALDKMQKWQAEQKDVRARAAIERNQDGLLNNKMSPTTGNPDATVTIVEFFDYQCGYCKRVWPMMKNLAKDRNDLRIVWKEFPILGPNSVTAAHAAMAVDKQGLYKEMHQALMENEEELSYERVETLAAQIGADTERMRHDMKNDGIGNYIKETRILAQEIGISGTPAFVIGKKFIGGAIGKKQMEEIIAEEMASKKD